MCCTSTCNCFVVLPTYYWIIPSEQDSVVPLFVFSNDFLALNGAFSGLFYLSVQHPTIPFLSCRVNEVKSLTKYIKLPESTKQLSTSFQMKLPPHKSLTSIILERYDFEDLSPPSFFLEKNWLQSISKTHDIIISLPISCNLNLSRRTTIWFCDSRYNEDVRAYNFTEFYNSSNPTNFICWTQNSSG